MIKDNNLGTVFIAVLLVSSVFAPFMVGNVFGATNTYQDTVTGSPKYVAIDGSDVNGSFTVRIQVDASQIPDANADTVIFKRDIGMGYELRHFVFANYGAYESLDVTVTTHDGTTGTPVIGAGSEFSFKVPEQIGSTGGDANLDCGIMEGLANAGNYHIVDCNSYVNDNIDVSSLNANETKLEMHRIASQSHNSQNQFNATYTNYIKDSENIALIKAKSAYIRALNDGSSTAIAESKGRQAIKDYYSQKQLQLIDRWETTATIFRNLHDTQLSASGVYTDTYTYMQIANMDYWPTDGASGFDGVNYNNNMPMGRMPTNMDYTFTRTLVNGTEVQVEGMYESSSSSGGTEYTGYFEPFKYEDSNYYYSSDSNGPRAWNIGMQHAPYEPIDSDPIVLDRRNWYIPMNMVQNQNTDAINEFNAFATQVSGNYSAGEIDSSDLVDPYVANSEYSPNDDYQAWALSQLQYLGVSNPSNLNTVGNMTVTDHTDNSTHNGILLSDGLPQEDTFVVGETYSASNLKGPQYVLTTDSMVELEGNFTLEKAVTSSGETQQSVTYKNITYETSNSTEFQNLMNELNENQQQIEEMQAELYSGGSGTTGDKDNPVSVPSWLTEKYAGIPLYGYIGVSLLALGVFTKGKN